MSEEYWKARYHAAEAAFGKLKTMTKQLPAHLWTDEYRELAGSIHSLGRIAFWVTKCGGCGECSDCKEALNGQTWDQVQQFKHD
jgi:hypothetical protein